MLQIRNDADHKLLFEKWRFPVLIFYLIQLLFYTCFHQPISSNVWQFLDTDCNLHRTKTFNQLTDFSSNHLKSIFQSFQLLHQITTANILSPSRSAFIKLFMCCPFHINWYHHWWYHRLANYSMFYSLHWDKTRWTWIP